MISKELFAEVVADKLPQGLCELNDLVIGDDNDIGYFHAQYQGCIDYGIQWISIYELAHKCLIYAWDQMYEITPRVIGAEITCLKTGYSLHIIQREDIENPKKFDPRFVIESCQWILDNKEH